MPVSKIKLSAGQWPHRDNVPATMIVNYSNTFTTAKMVYLLQLVNKTRQHLIHLQLSILRIVEAIMNILCPVIHTTHTTLFPRKRQIQAIKFPMVAPLAG